MFHQAASLCASDIPLRSRGFSLSLGERAGVGGKGVRISNGAPFASNPAVTTFFSPAKKVKLREGVEHMQSHRNFFREMSKVQSPLSEGGESLDIF